MDLTPGELFQWMYKETSKKKSDTCNSLIDLAITAKTKLGVLSWTLTDQVQIFPPGHRLQICCPREKLCRTTESIPKTPDHHKEEVVECEGFV